MSVNKRTIAVALSLLLSLSISSTPVFAYKTLSHQVSNTVHFVSYVGFNSAEVSHMTSAAAQWNSATPYNETLLTIYGTHSNMSVYGKKDGNNYICREVIDSDINAQCTYWYNIFGNLTESDIDLNGYYDWSTTGESEHLDVWSLFLHEAGHTMGLADLYSSSDQNAVMYGYSNFSTMKRYLTQDDINGIVSIYS